MPPISQPPHQPTNPATAATAPGLTPPQRLSTLAATLTAVPADTHTNQPYDYLHIQSWTRATNVISRTDVRRWRSTINDSGQEIIRRAEDQLGANYQPTPTERLLFDHAPEKTRRYPIGALSPYLAHVPTQPAVLADILAPRQLANETEYARLLLDGVVGLATSQYLNREQRVATLGVLATAPGIAYLGPTTDLAGRPGLVFAVTTTQSTSQITIDPTTGEILTAQERLTAGPRPGLFAYTLIVDRGKATPDALPKPPEHGRQPATATLPQARNIIDLVLAGNDTAALDALRTLDEYTRQQLGDAATCLLALHHELTHPPGDDHHDDRDSALLSLHVAVEHTQRAGRMLHDPLDAVDPDIAAGALAAISALINATAETVNETRLRVMQSYPAATRGEYATLPYANPATELRIAENALRDLELHLHRIAGMASVPERTLAVLTRHHPPAHQA